MKSDLQILIFALACTLAAGCDVARSTKDVRETPEIKEAVQAEREGDYDKAIERYKDAIAHYPNTALPYIQLATLLDERKDYLGAVYNYRRYLEVSARSNEAGDVKVVEGRLAKAKQCLAAEYVSMVSASGPDTAVRLSQELEKLNARVVALEQEKGNLLSSNETLRVSIGKLNTEIASKNKVIERLKNSSSAGQGDKTYEVRSGDSLSQIAGLMYGDPSKWTLIRDANPTKVQGDRVKPGDVLVIPSL